MYPSLKDTLFKDIQELITIDIPLDIVLKPFSNTLYACYRVNTDRIFLYVFKDREKTTLYSYEHYLTETIHEVCHFLQYHNILWERKKGIMHDADFKHMLKEYTELARRKNLFDKKMVWFNGKLCTCHDI